MQGGLHSLQIQRVMKIICRSLLDNAVTLSQKNTLIYYLHELNAEYGRRRGAVPRSAQFEILTCLVDLCKILRAQLVATLAQIKQQEASREASGPGASAARLDTEPLFELGESALLQAAKPHPPNYQGSNQPRDRYAQARPGEVTEAHKEVFGKVMWNLVASAHSN